MKKSVIIVVLIVLISSISLALEPGKLWINDVFIPSGLEKITELEKPTAEPKQISYVYANGQRIAKVENNEVYYFHNDHLGSPRVITNSIGEVVEKIDYLPFGESFTKNEKISYNSKELDFDTKLNYYGARYYSSPAGRFITADTVKGDLIDPQSLNLYVYTRNNPMKYIDPSGNQEKKATIFIADIGDWGIDIPFIRSPTKEAVNTAIKATSNLISAYENEGYETIDIILGYQSSNKAKSMLEKGLNVQSLTESETSTKVELLLKDQNKENLVSFIGHSYRMYDFTRLTLSGLDDGPFSAFTANVLELKNSEVFIRDWEKKHFFSNVQCEFFGCAIMNYGYTTHKGLRISTNLRKTQSYKAVVEWFNHFVDKDYWWFKEIGWGERIKK